MDSCEEINIIKGILNARCRGGATVEDIQDDFTEFIGKPWQMADKTFDEIQHYMGSIDGVYCIGSRGGLAKWYIQSEETVHIQKMIQKQKRSTDRSPISKKRSTDRSLITTNTFLNKTVQPKECFFKDNYAYKYKRYRIKSASDSSDHLNEIGFNNTQLLGDDFFLSLLTMEMNYPLTRKLPNQSGLSRSGLCIRGAISILESVAYIKTPSIVINVGSIDIMQGRDLIDMQTDYKELVNVCIKRNVQPIITTLAPLANTSHYYSRDMRDKLILFNNFLINCYYPHYQVINLWSQLVTPRGRTLFEYFEPESIYVTGSSRPHVLWNQFGRQKILDHIRKNVP